MIIDQPANHYQAKTEWVVYFTDGSKPDAIFDSYKAALSYFSHELDRHHLAKIMSHSH